MAAKSEEYQRFESLLARVVQTPREVVKQREEEEANVQEWRVSNGLPKTRKRISGDVADDQR
jgi:hypothetical protein